MIVERKLKKKFIEKIAEENLLKMLKEMGNSRISIEKFQKKRIQQSAVFFFLMLLAGLFLSSWFYLAAFVLPVYFYKLKYKKISSLYTKWKFQRHQEFSKFARLLIPYLKQNEGNLSLYSVFNKILNRLDKEEDRNSLYELMTEMSNKPNDITPYIEFANRSSGTDMSVMFMSTIFDYQQSSFDTSVIDELGRLASEELMIGIDEIVQFKLKRFSFFPTKIVMSSMIMVGGYAIAILVGEVSKINF